MLKELEKHHLGIVVSTEQIPAIEERYGKKFHTDATQGVRVLFTYDDELQIYKEFIVNEGRAENYPLGFHHVCYKVTDQQQMHSIESMIKQNKLGFRLTFPEQSGSDECGVVSFFNLKSFGVVEFSVEV